jgi:D-alanine-D-alanine ligase
MRICTLNSSYEGTSSPFEHLDPYPDPSIWLPEHEWTSALLTKKNAIARIDELVAQGVDVFINLCDGEKDEGMAGVEVIQHLEALGVPFTGSDSRFYARSRESVKQAYVDHGIGTPRYGFAADGDEAVRAASSLRFPIIVKPAHGYSSLGIERDSVVRDTEQLRERAGRTAAAFGGVLLEEFIEGPEFTVLAAEPREPGGPPIVYQPLEVCFEGNETFKHFDLKWKDFGLMKLRPSGDPEITKKLRELGAKTFTSLNISSYARFDIRMDQDGNLYMLDSNPNCGIFYAPEAFGAADFILASEPEGHAGFIRHIIQCAFRRARLSRPHAPPEALRLAL